MGLTQYPWTGADGTAATSANSGGATSSFTVGGTATYRAAGTHAKGTGTAIEFTKNGTSSTAYIRYNTPTADNKLAFSFRVQLPAAAPAQNETIGRVRHAGGTIFAVVFDSAGRLAITDTAGAATTVATAAALTAAGLGPAAWCRVTGVLTVGNPGSFEVKLWKEDGTLVTTLSSTTANLGTAAAMAWDAGLPTANTATNTTIKVADLQLDPGGTTHPPESAAPGFKPPVANAGADFTVDPNLGGTFTLTGSGSDPDGGVLTYAWEDVTGAPVALSGSGATRTVAIPVTQGGTTRTYRLTVTDATALSSTDTVVVTALPHTRRMMTALDGLVPIRRAL